MGAAASVWILILWAMILVTLVTFSRHSRLAAWLLVPYIAWVTFAALLAWTVWRLNPVLLGL